MKFRQLELFGEDGPEVGGSTVPEPLPAPVASEQPAELETAPPPEPTTAAPDTEEALPVATEAPTPKRHRRQSRQSAKSAVTIELPPDELLYARQYYGIGEVASMFQEKVSVLRYWESEFEVLDLRKNRKGDRFFRPDDIKTVRLIHHLLRERRFTIEGAREYIRHNNARGREKVETIETLRRIRGFLVGMRESLVSRQPTA